MKKFAVVFAALSIVVAVHAPARAQGILWSSYKNKADKSVQEHDDKTAKKLYDLAFQEVQKSDDNYAKLETMIKLGDCDSRLGEIAAASSLYQQALKPAESSYGPNSQEVGFVLVRLGRTEVQQNKLADAERDLTLALDIENKFPSNARTTLMRALADLYSKQKKTVEAQALREECERASGHAPTPMAVGSLWLVPTPERLESSTVSTANTQAPPSHPDRSR